MSKPSDFTEVLTEDLLRQTAYNQEFIEANTYRHPGPQPFQFQPPAPSWFTGDHPYVHTPQVGDHRTFLQDPQAPQGFLYPHHVQLRVGHLTNREETIKPGNTGNCRNPKCSKPLLHIYQKYVFLCNINVIYIFSFLQQVLGS